MIEHYHEKSNIESTHAAIKRKSREALRSKSRAAQENELLAKIIVYRSKIFKHKKNASVKAKTDKVKKLFFVYQEKKKDY